MERRKIQLIAGSTYTVSLPKDWIIKNHLKAKNEVVINEKDDKTLVISADSLKESSLNEMSLNIDEYIDSIDQVLFAIYYLGAESITLFSKKEISKDVKSKIRKTLAHMSGTEISYEDRQKIEIKVLLDRSKIDINQIIYRIGLILELSLTNLVEQFDMEELSINENEIDRLYHLILKIVSLSLIDANILNSSKIKKVTSIPSYFLIGKKLENIGDNIYYIASLGNKNFEHKNDILEFVKNEIIKSTRFAVSDFEKKFEKAKIDELKSINEKIGKIKNQAICDYIKDIIRYIIDIQEELFIISFYKKLTR